MGEQPHLQLLHLRLGLLALVFVATLDKLGVDTASLFALVGAAGLAIGLALKDTAADVAAGIALSEWARRRYAGDGQLIVTPRDR